MYGRGDDDDDDWGGLVGVLWQLEVLPGARGCGWDRAYPRLCATYGMTEACVYQTFGEIADVAKVEGPGNIIGHPLLGTNVWI